VDIRDSPLEYSFIRPSEEMHLKNSPLLKVQEEVGISIPSSHLPDVNGCPFIFAELGTLLAKSY
jgi:hypothetical protein